MTHDIQIERFDEALQRVEHAVQQVCVGEFGPFADLWSRADDASLFGAFGPATRGWQQLEPVFPWVASRYRDGMVEIDYVSVVEGAELACTVGYERAVVSIDGAPEAPSTIRVTHVFRLENGRWALIHRHGDFADDDRSRQPGAGG